MLMYIADTHCDTLYALAKGRNTEELMVNRKKMLAGSVTLQTFALFTGSNGTRGGAYSDARRMLACMDKLEIAWLLSKLPDDYPVTPSGIISIEGGEALEGKIERLHEFYDQTALRMIALTWNYENEIGYPSKLGSEPGLKPFGLQLLKEMDRLGIYADASHLNERGFWDIYEHMSLPPIASHSNNREICDIHRNLTRAQIQAIIERRGYIGINFYTSFLTKNETASLDDVVRHIDSIMEMGGEDVLGFGSDFDGIEKWPLGLHDSSCFPNLINALAARGYTESQLEKLSHLNLWRLLKDADNIREYKA